MVKIVLTLMATCLAAVVGLEPAFAQKRWALVVGINDYNATLESLSKAVPDARAAASALRSDALGFDVELLDTAELTTFAAVRSSWIRLLRKVGKGDILLFYFAGHGIELDGHNYFLMSDTQIVEKEMAPEVFDGDILKLGSLDLQRLLEELAAVQKDTQAVGVFIVDACREKLKLANARTVLDFGHDLDLASGLGPIRPPSEVFVMYSAGIGQTALDGDPADSNSVYARFLLPLLQEPSLSLADLAQRVRADVYPEALKYEQHIQTPAYYDQLRSSRTIRGSFAATEKTYGPSSTFSNPRGLRPGNVLAECWHCPEMVVLPTGSSFMGSPDEDEEATVYEKPRQRVDILSLFAIGRFEVTNQEWNRCIDDGGCKGEIAVREYAQRLKPAARVSWDGTQKYLNWLNTKVGGQRYRLPTEAEWEYAARAGSFKRYSFGADARKLCLYANGADLSVGGLFDINTSCSDGIGRETAQVGSYLPNGYGLHDMHGNVWEWVQDCWHPTHAGRLPDARQAREPSDPASCRARVARGGSWRSNPLALRTATRHFFPPDHRRPTLGFRVVRDIAPEEQ